MLTYLKSSQNSPNYTITTKPKKLGRIRQSGTINFAVIGGTDPLEILKKANQTSIIGWPLPEEKQTEDDWIINYDKLGFGKILNLYPIRTGRQGGKKTTDAKSKAARENGKKGGWPKGKPRGKKN